MLRKKLQKGSKKIFNCNSCNMKYDRDMNACRNILIKSLN